MEAQATVSEPRNLVLCSDGTGNRGGKTRGTNVWRISRGVDPNSRAPRQLVFYDDGVGTEDYKLWKLLGGAFGVGLSRNVRQLYEWLALNYRDGDRIFLFGFSRGAFTVRSLAGMIKRCGLLRAAEHPVSELHERVKEVYARYRKERTGGGDDCRTDVAVHFLGVWDTVGALGGPPWLRYGRWSPLRSRNRHHDIDADNWHYACHALAIDDERRTFWPELLPASENGSTVHQVWFPGAHSNVGGGNPKDGIAFVTLNWMMRHAHGQGLRFTSQAWDEVSLRANVHDRIYDPRAGLAAFYRYAPRIPSEIVDHQQKRNEALAPGRLRVPERARANEYHESVFERIARSADRYAPVLLFEHPAGQAIRVAPTAPTAPAPPSLPAARAAVPAKAFAALPQAMKDAVRKGLEPAQRPISRLRRLYFVLLFGTLAIVSAALLVHLLTRGTEPVFPYTFICALLSFPIPFDVVDGVLESLARLASVRPWTSGFVLTVFVLTVRSLYRWRRRLKAKVHRCGLDAWEILRKALGHSVVASGRTERPVAGTRPRDPVPPPPVSSPEVLGPEPSSAR